ncbi:hypothetical protein [Roseovarius nanhaiticus]|uniref:hypothetical protein n=1 Tax=Roseovarius nanhaiticus TaxID=573024 RepID=UPI002491DA8A|nr:hypothetical protein [Roseovarius nanhaiticus]
MQTSLRRFSLFAIPFLVAAPALAQNAGSEGCAATARIVAGAVEMRVDGADKSTAAQALAAGDVGAKYADAVVPLVEWVYTLPTHQLTDEAASAFNDACLAQMG